MTSLLLKIVNSQRFLGILTKVIAGSGFLTVPFIHQWFPDVTPQSASGIAVEAISFLIGVGIGWYRDHPDNILARAVKVINGGTASPAAVQATQTAATEAVK